MMQIILFFGKDGVCFHLGGYVCNSNNSYCFQNGFTTAIDSITISNTVGTSLNARKYTPEYIFFLL